MKALQLVAKLWQSAGSVNRAIGKSRSLRLFGAVAKLSRCFLAPCSFWTPSASRHASLILSVAFNARCVSSAFNLHKTVYSLRSLTASCLQTKCVLSAREESQGGCVRAGTCEEGWATDLAVQQGQRVYVSVAASAGAIELYAPSGGPEAAGEAAAGGKGGAEYRLVRRLALAGDGGPMGPLGSMMWSLDGPLLLARQNAFEVRHARLLVPSHSSSAHFMPLIMFPFARSSGCTRLSPTRHGCYSCSCPPALSRIKCVNLDFSHADCSRLGSVTSGKFLDGYEAQVGHVFEGCQARCRLCT